jgi:putative hemolysin
VAADLRYILGHLILMVLLLCCSAFFSGSETAFFNLSRRQIELFKRSDHRFQNLAASLASRPPRLLSCLLFGNMCVNILFYAISSTLIVRIQRRFGVTPAAVAAFFTFLSVVIFGEIVPKSFAYINSRAISAAVALPAYLCLRLFGPIVAVFRFLIVDPALRLILGPVRRPHPITPREYISLIDHVKRKGLITSAENRLLTEIVRLGTLKVRHVMVPRVDMPACPLSAPPHKAGDIMTRHNITKVPAYVVDIDNIVGLVYLRDILLEPCNTLDTMVRPANFVPEQKTVESLLEHFRVSRTDTAIVVDEYGQIAGSVSLEDIAEELVGPLRTRTPKTPIEIIGPLRYRLAGNIPIRQWADALDIDAEDLRAETIAGLVTALLGKIPAPGDVARLRNLKFTVEKVTKNRIDTIILELQAIKNDDN